MPDFELEDAQVRLIQAFREMDAAEVSQAAEGVFLSIAREPDVSIAHAQAICLGVVSRGLGLLAEYDRKTDDQQKLEVELWQDLLSQNSLPGLVRCFVNTCQEMVSRASARRRQRKHHVVSAVQEHVRNHFQESLTIRDLANLVHMNPNYLSGLFKAEVGETFSDYLLRVRMERAKDLLMRPDARVYEVAESVGYVTAAYFSSQFKKFTGQTPAEFRSAR